MGESLFGMRLWRLLSHRRLAAGSSTEKMQAELATKAGVPTDELGAVVREGVAPSPELIRKLAPPLGIHTADLFVVAGLPVPRDLGSAWRTSPYDVGSILLTALRMSADQRNRLGALIGSLPVRPEAVPETPPGDRYQDVPGAMLLRLVRNRNIRPYNARLLMLIGDGPYVSPSTVAGLGVGRVVITPQYVTAFAHLLGYRPGDIVALTGVGPVVDDARRHPASVELAALAWQARRLTGEQLAEVMAAIQHTDAD
jgi:hypothetical protein